LDLPGVRAACESIAADRVLVRRFQITDGTDQHRYVNLMFATDDLRRLWRLLGQRLYHSAELGGPMRASSMAMCEGQHGWDDYLLLYHFDPAVPRDVFAD
jgi:hypothetical protein